MMAKQRSLFQKYLRVNLAIVLVSFLLIGVVLLIFMTSYWRSEKTALLKKNAEGISVVASQNLIPLGDNSYRIDSRVGTMIDLFAQNIDAQIFLTDGNGTPVLYSQSATTFADSTRTVPLAVVQEAMQSGYVGSTTLGGIFQNSYNVVGVPVTNTLGTEIIGAVFAASDAQYLDQFRVDVLKIFVLAAAVVFAASFIAVGMFSYRMVRPLREMAMAARSFGAGDFSRRVPVTSQDEIGQLALAFNNMASSLSSSEGMRRSFIANVSHELKTPMTTIAGFIDGILDGTIPPDKERHYLKIVSDEVKRLSRLVRTMLDLSRIDSGELKITKQRFDLTDTVVNTLMTFENLIEKRNIQVTGLEESHSVFVDGDPDMLHQVVYNLIENAVKFVNEGGVIELHVTEASNRVNFSIRNTGAGISADEIGLIFDKFYKTDKSRSQDKNGMGLGLYIVRTIIKRHGGDITVKSTEGEFCQFDFWLPKISQVKEQPKLQ